MSKLILLALTLLVLCFGCSNGFAQGGEYGPEPVTGSCLVVTRQWQRPCVAHGVGPVPVTVWQQWMRYLGDSNGSK